MKHLHLFSITLLLGSVFLAGCSHQTNNPISEFPNTGEVMTGTSSTGTQQTGAKADTGTLTGFTKVILHDLGVEMVVKEGMKQEDALFYPQGEREGNICENKKGPYYETAFSLNSVGSMGVYGTNNQTTCLETEMMGIPSRDGISSATKTDTEFLIMPLSEKEGIKREITLGCMAPGVPVLKGKLFGNLKNQVNSIIISYPLDSELQKKFPGSQACDRLKQEFNYRTIIEKDYKILRTMIESVKISQSN